MTISPLVDVVAAQKNGRASGIPSICSANLHVLEASFSHAKAHGLSLLIESTCNQVNQYGGYTGQTPAEFMMTLRQLAEAHDFPLSQLEIGGDHLGPNPWQDEPAAQAMDKSRQMVRDYVSAGYTKIHLDASMHCRDDDPQAPLPVEVVAARSADLALIAEQTYKDLGESAVARPHYVIGTEVPVPGGALEVEETLAVTDTADVAETIEITRAAFLERGLEAAWERVIAVVVQPGVEFGDTSLFEYDPVQGQALKQFIEDDGEGLVYEAHSTDYQTREALAALIRDHFAILKVGPALTFALRESVFALAMIEEELLAGKSGSQPSRIRETLDEAMLGDPVYWQRHYHGNASEQALARQFSFSDRIRYYWLVPEVQDALQSLLANLSAVRIPLPLLSQYMPNQYQAIREGRLADDPRSMILGRIMVVLDDYAWACRMV